MLVIINCDDFGMSEEINQGVYEAHISGCLPSATILVDGAAVDNAIQIAYECPRLGIGLHINLDRFLGYGINGYSGHTLSNIDAGRYMQSMQHLDRIERSIDYQFAQFSSFGIPMSHVDGHHHVHLLPGIFQRVIQIASKYNVHKIRFFRSFYEKELTSYEEHYNILQKNGFKYVSDFRDFSQAESIVNLDQYITEVMVHISKSGPNSEEWRINQFERLMSIDTISRLKTQSAKIINYNFL